MVPQFPCRVGLNATTHVNPQTPRAFSNGLSGTCWVPGALLDSGALELFLTTYFLRSTRPASTKQGKPPAPELTLQGGGQSGARHKKHTFGKLEGDGASGKIQKTDQGQRDALGGGGEGAIFPSQSLFFFKIKLLSFLNYF